MKRKEKQRMKRFSALFLSLMLICALSMTAFATEGGGASDNAPENTTAATEGGQTVAASTHSYTAYQIFAGEYDKESGKLSDIKWGKNAQNSEIQGAIAEALGLSAGAPLTDILTALGNVGDETDVANKLAAAIASKADKLGTGEPVSDGSDVEPGYYIVIDTTEKFENGESRNLALLQCPDGKIKIKAKTGTVTSDKKVMDTNDSEGYNPAGDALDTSADYDIGDKVPFELTGTVAENYDMFKTYKFVFHDTESKGLTFNNDVSVTIDGTQITSGYKVDTTPEDGDTFEVIFDDLKTIGVNVGPGSEIKISYTSTLNKDAVIGAAGNENTMYLEYSNNPYKDETGTTPKKTVIVFTYKVEVNKVDDKGGALAGAGFALYKVDNNYKDDNGNIKDDGVLNADNSKQNVLNGKTYNKLVARYETDPAQTKFSFEGIDDGEYLLVETQTPAGYNSIEPVEFTVTAGHADGALTTLNGNPIAGSVQLTFTPDAGSGTLGTDVVNKSGSLLPSTGGIGTTMFYIIGGVLMVGACMMLFVRKIMTNEKR
ncbi:MAG: isopeptide-forming domain-containing fimbrial protein [Lachnospiraceae bacterium]|nr:isopeptide-forming domain-containing fimbrial protein [Lachnospiraceae bacterium]